MRSAQKSLTPEPRFMALSSGKIARYFGWQGLFVHWTSSHHKFDSGEKEVQLAEKDEQTKVVDQETGVPIPMAIKNCHGKPLAMNLTIISLEFL
jgi:hypothetical protein